MCKDLLEKKNFWGFLILIFVIFAFLFIMTAIFTRSNIYEPNEIDLNGNTFLKLKCESSTQFFTSLSNIKCYTGIRSETWNYSFNNLIIRGGYENRTGVWGCSVQLRDIKSGNQPVMHLCKNSFYNDTIERPANKVYMELYYFEGIFEQNPTGERLIIREVFFDRPIEVMSRNEELSIEISRNNLFVATLALIILAVLEFRKFLLGDQRKRR